MVKHRITVKDQKVSEYSNCVVGGKMLLAKLQFNMGEYNEALWKRLRELYPQINFDKKGWIYHHGTRELRYDSEEKP